MAMYAESSQRLHGKYTPKLLEELRTLDHAHMSKEEYRAIQMWLHEQVKMLATKLSLKQQAIATSMVYLLRFYTRAAFIETNVHMIIAAAVYLACKIEECPQHIKVVTTEIQTVWGLGKVSCETQKLAEAEFYLINELDTYLIVHHPYRILNQFSEAWRGWQADFESAWVIINESYSTDIPLLYDPDTIAYTSLYLGLVKRRYGTTSVFSTSSSSSSSSANSAAMLDDIWSVITTRAKVNMREVARCTQSFLAFWRFRDGAKPLPDGEAVMKRAKEELHRQESGAAEKEAKSRAYKEKIQAMQKR